MRKPQVHKLVTIKPQLSRAGIVRRFVVGAILAAAVLFPAQATLIGNAQAANTWVDGSMPKVDLGSRVSGPNAGNCTPDQFTYSSYTTPTGGFSNTIREVPLAVCAQSNQLGQFGQPGTSTHNYYNEFIRPNTLYAYRVLDPNGRAIGIAPVPNQKTFVYHASVGFVGGMSLNFFDGFPSAGDFGAHYYSNQQELVYKMKPTPPPLKDAAGNTIAMMNGRAFSNNGKWMVIEAGNLGYIRINTQTREMLLFSTDTISYTMGFSPSTIFAISDDGNTVIRSGSNGNIGQVFDLSNCQPAPIRPGGSQNNPLTGCRQRQLAENISTQVSGFESFWDIRFNGDGQSITGRLSRLNGNVREYYSMTYSVAGYTAPKTAYLALGDSFSSGEGAHDYVQGTDSTNPLNKCHLSGNSYPYVTARVLGITNDNAHSVACSGAKILNYSSELQAEQVASTDANKWLPGIRTQKDYVQAAGSTDAVTISMGGNDVGFSNKITRCIALADTCFHFREDREDIAHEIYNNFDKLVTLYKEIRHDTKEAKVYVLGYPQLFSTNDACGLNAPLDAGERQMSRGLVTYLNAVTKAATQKAGVQYIDVENAFTEKALCGTDAVKAVNGLTAGNDITLPAVVPLIGSPVTPRFDVPLVGNESFHPNALGHQLMSQALLSQSENLTKAMPTSNSSTTAPFVGSAVYSNFIGSAPSGGTLKRAVYTLVDGSEALLRGLPVTVNIPDYLKPSSVFEFWFNSTPTYAGSLTSDANGRLTGEITVPASLPAGYHTLHIYGRNVAGETIDMSRTVYIAASATDYDGDGITNADDKCQVVQPSNVDRDKDGVDDACDGEITEPPADSAPPTVTGVPDRQPDHDGWYTSDVTINWSTDDPVPSSGVPTQPASTVVTAEGDHVYTSGPSCDAAGNCATGSFAVKLDKTDPTIDFTLSSAPTADGWYNGPVTITFVCNDPASVAGAASGIANCSEPVTVSSGSTFVTGAVTDHAGRTSGVNVFIDIDSDKPTVSQTTAPAANAAGWHNSDVTVTAVCDDELSGIAASGCSPATTLTTEAASQPVTSTATDKAGNSASNTTYVSIDKTAPTLGTIAWATNPKATSQTAKLTVPVTDSLSGITEAEYFLGDTDPGQGNGATMTISADRSAISTSFGTDFPTGVYKVSFRTKDTAGNWSSVASDYLVVYNPTGVRMTGKKTIVPSFSNGDALPGLTSTSTDVAKFGFNVRYGDDDQIHKQSDFQFSYRTGSDCSKPAQAQNCHSFDLNANSVAWLATQGTNNSTGIFEGTGSLVVDGVARTVLFRLTGLDGERLNATSQDHLTLKVYNAQDNPNTATAIYKVDADVVRGNIRIRTE